MIRVVHIGLKPKCNGGIEHFLLNVLREIDKTKVMFFFVFEEKDSDDFFNEIVKKNGGHIIIIKSNNKKTYHSALRNELKNISFDIAHIHVTCGSRLLDGFAAKRCNKRAKIIFHSHTKLPTKPLKYKLLSPLFRTFSSKLFACTKEAGIYFFGKSIIHKKKFSVIPNGINVKEFLFDKRARDKIRLELNISSNAKVLGFVGRLSPEKNFEYSVNVFRELLKQGEEYIFVIVGDGQELQNIVSLINQYSIKKEVILVGNRNNVNDYMSSFDALILPSLFESFGIVLVEGQLSGLHCFGSNVIPGDVLLSNRMHFFDLKQSPSLVASSIIKCLDSDNSRCVDEAMFAQYSSRTSANKLLMQYEEVLNK